MVKLDSLNIGIKDENIFDDHSGILLLPSKDGITDHYYHTILLVWKSNNCLFNSTNHICILPSRN
jgi:hypothetical protein